MFLDAAGIILIVAGLVFAWIGKGAEAGEMHAFKVDISGKSWLILVVVGAALIVTERSLPDNHVADAPAIGTLDTVVYDYDRLSTLWDECGAGNDTSCNSLYSESPADSDWEAYGSSCGDRAPEPTFGACPLEQPADTTDTTEPTETT